MQPSVMVDQVKDLPVVMREQTRSFDMIARTLLTPLEYASLRRVYLTGDGDSYHSTMAAEMAFKNIAKIPCEPMSAQRYLDYGAEWMTVPSFPNSVLLVGISASGKTQRVVQSLERGKEFQALTVALTGTPGSAVTQTAERSFVVQVPDRGPSPGIRTFTASLLGLYLLAIRIGELRNKYTQDEANAFRQELIAAADVVEATIQACLSPAKEAAAALKDASGMVWVGSGPSYGTAIFNAAKSVEAASILAVGQDLEEWWHVERFALPANMPIFVVAPPGRSHWRATNVAEVAKSLGKRVIAVVQDGDTEITRHADFVLPVMGDVREEFSPLVYHIAGDLMGSFLAEALGRKLFQTDNPAFRAAMAAAASAPLRH
jgi:glucosamine--fructose-6-phosphate aminotransferase (isomerizing)